MSSPVGSRTARRVAGGGHVHRGVSDTGMETNPDLRSFLEEVSSEELRSLAVACFDTCFRMPRWMTDSAAKVMTRKLQEKGIALLVPPESFFVKGMEGPSA
jgi:hypothetical protein